MPVIDRPLSPNGSEGLYSKSMNSALQTMNFGLKVMNFGLKTMNFAFKMMESEGVARTARYPFMLFL